MRKTNTGAHRWVTQRMRKKPAVVDPRSVGLAPMGAKKLRTWSNIIKTMTKPLSQSRGV